MNCEVGDLRVWKIYKFLRFVSSSNKKSFRHSISQVYLPSIWLLLSLSNPVKATDLDSEFQDPETRRRYKRGLVVILGYTAITLSFLICIHLRKKICTQRDEVAAATAAEHDEYSIATATKKLDMELFPEIVFAETDAKFHFTECHICLEEFKQGESLVVLPTCAHAYHKDCIHRWMATRNSCCPDCRHDYGFV